ncbi:TAXI family TRAP transporter solute-binding subunit [Methylocella sp.]|uniref:TAXI family TRAP transporter solute-binding subunit n=1 Tax=Methylocella sp. TaxID=1978226 RepID=UPI003C1A1006
MRLALLVTAGVLIITAAGLAAYYFILPHAALRVTTGAPGTAAHRFVAAFAATTIAQHPRVQIRMVEVADLAASAKAIENHAVDLAIIRSDAVIPANGETIAILRRDVFAVVTPAKTAIDKIPSLVDRTIGIPQGPLQSYNEHALDTVLSYYNIQPSSVKRVFLPMAEIGHALADKRIAAMLAIGPMGPGEVVDVVAAVKAATKSSPKILGIDEADAINKQFPGFESIDVPAGAFRGRPAIPDDTVSTLAVTYRFVAPNTMLDIVAGAIAQSLFTAKAKLMQSTPLAAQIEAPDPDDKNPVLPVHPGVAAYLNNGQQSFFDEFQSYFYMGGLALSTLGSLAAVVVGRLNRRKSQEELSRIDRLIGLADQALRARRLPEIEALEEELNGIVGWFVKNGGGGDGSAFSVAIAHARYAIDKQRTTILRETTNEAKPKNAALWPEAKADPSPQETLDAPHESSNVAAEALNS